MNDKRGHEIQDKQRPASNRPIHSAGDIHDEEEGMPLTLAAGGYGGTPRTTDGEEAEEVRDEK